MEAAFCQSGRGGQHRSFFRCLILQELNQVLLEHDV